MHCLIGKAILRIDDDESFKLRRTHKNLSLRRNQKEMFYDQLNPAMCIIQVEFSTKKATSMMLVEWADYCTGVK